MPEHGEGIALGEVIAFTGGRRLAPAPDGFLFSRVWTDSRTVVPGDLFVALQGQRFDGHRFVAEALERGACGVLVERPPEGEVLRRYEPVVVIVSDTLKALGDLASGWRRKHQIPVAVMTGSNGKTTVKEMTVAILRLCFCCLWSPGNYNNRIGLSLTLLSLRPHHERVVLEMGMNEPGEIRILTRIACPQAGALLNVGPAHLERFGTLEAVARAKAEMLEEMPEDAVLVFNQDDPRVRALAGAWTGKKVGFGRSSDVCLIEVDDAGLRQRVRIRVLGREVETEIRLPGLHNLQNALAAAALSSAMGAPVGAVGEGLARFEPVRGRFVVRSYQDFTVVDDSYNANPASMASALDTLERLRNGAEVILVLGDMLELGILSDEAHQELGRRAARIRPRLLCVTGRFAERVIEGAREGGLPGERILLFESPEAVADRIIEGLRGGEWILVKGSRAMALERVVAELDRRGKPFSGGPQPA